MNENVRRNPDGSITVGVINRPVEKPVEKTEAKPVEKAEKPKKKK